VPSICSLAQAKAGSLSEGFLSPERELFSLSEIDLSVYVRVSHDWMMGALNSLSYDAIYALYDILGLELIRWYDYAYGT